MIGSRNLLRKPTQILSALKQLSARWHFAIALSLLVECIGRNIRRVDHRFLYWTTVSSSRSVMSFWGVVFCAILSSQFMAAQAKEEKTPPTPLLGYSSQASEKEQGWEQKF